MKSIRFLLLPFIGFFLFISCGEDDPIIGYEPEPEPIPVPDLTLPHLHLSAINGDKEVTLLWENMRAIVEYSSGSDVELPYVSPPEPDYYEVYTAFGDCGTPHLLVTLKPEDMQTYVVDCLPPPKNHYTHKGLENKKEYEYHVVAYKEGYNSTVSNTILIWPDSPPEVHSFFPDNETATSPFHELALSPQKDKIAYVEKVYLRTSIYPPAYSQLMLANADGSNKEIIVKGGNNPSWSPDGKKIVFNLFSTEEYISHIYLYDTETKEISQLTNDKSSGFHPVFNTSGNKILYDSMNGISYNIRMFDLETMTDQEIINASAYNFRSIERPVFVDENRFYFQALLSEGYDKRIYESSLHENDREPKMIDVPFFEYYPFSFSPDGTYFAYLSMKTGTHQVWVYNRQTKSHRILTGYKENEEVYPDGFRISWIDNTTVYFPINQHYPVIAKVE